MDKVSFGGIPGLNWEYISDRFVRHGLPAVAIGGGIAGLAHFLSMRKKQEEDAKTQQQKNDTIVIEVPTKNASVLDSIKQMGSNLVNKAKGPSTGQYVWDAPLAVGSALAGGSIGYALVDKILKKYREKQLENELDSLKSQYSRYLAQDMLPKSASEYPSLDGLALSLSEISKSLPVEQSRKEAAAHVMKEAYGPETLGTMALSLPGVAALLSGILAHNYYYNRSKDVERGLEKEEAEKMKIAPKNIKIVSVPAESVMVSKKSKGKSKKEDEIPLDELLGKGATEILPMPSIATPAGNVAPILQKMIEHKEDKDVDLSSSDRESRRKDKILSEEDLQQIDPNTLVLMTDQGPIQIDALDPQALKALEKHKDLILRSFALGMNTK